MPTYFWYFYDYIDSKSLRYNDMITRDARPPSWMVAILGVDVL